MNPLPSVGAGLSFYALHPRRMTFVFCGQLRVWGDNWGFSNTLNHVLTALPASTHLRQGRAGSHPRCFFLQLTQADAT